MGLSEKLKSWWRALMIFLRFRRPETNALYEQQAHLANRVKYQRESLEASMRQFSEVLSSRKRTLSDEKGHSR